MSLLAPISPCVLALGHSVSYWTIFNTKITYGYFEHIQIDILLYKINGVEQMGPTPRIPAHCVQNNQPNLPYKDVCTLNKTCHIKVYAIWFKKRLSYIQLEKLGQLEIRQTHFLHWIFKRKRALTNYLITWKHNLLIHYSLRIYYIHTYMFFTALLVHNTTFDSKNYSYLSNI